MRAPVDPTGLPDVLARVGHTPLVPLRNVGRGLPVPVLVKMEWA